MRPYSIKLTPAIEALLDELAEERGISRAAVVREALVAYAAREISSAADAAGDLVGSLKGPRDLSTAPEHLAGFGE
jgi:predicted transcriptional regulator